MSEKLVRTQIYLEPDQRCSLKEIARREKRSFSAITRQVIDAGLQALERDSEVWKQRAQVLAEFRALREEQPFVYTGDLINEAREEQEEDRERIEEDLQLLRLRRPRS